MLICPIDCTAKTKYRNFETNIPRKGISGSQSQFPHSCVCERFIYFHDLSAYSARGNMQTDPGTLQIAHRHMNVEIGAEAALFPKKEYIYGIFVAVWTIHEALSHTAYLLLGSYFSTVSVTYSSFLFSNSF